MGRAERTPTPETIPGGEDLDIEIDLTDDDPDGGAAAPLRPSGSWRPRLAMVATIAVISLAAGVGLSRTAGRSPAGALLAGPVRITPAGPAGIDPYRGPGAWVDVYDYAPAYQPRGHRPVIGPGDLRGMRAAGVRTLYLQTAGTDGRTRGDVAAPDVTAAFLAAAHRLGLRVVAWYTPTLTDMEGDVARLAAASRFEAGGERFDGLALDIQPAGRDPAGRSRRLIELSRRLEGVTPPDLPLGAIVPPPVLLEDINPGAWPGFPWRELARTYDVWIPLNYWTLRRPPHDDPARFTAENLDRLRLRLGDPDAAVHALGGVGGDVTEGDAAAFVDAARAGDAIGASIYDYRSLAVGALRIVAAGVPATGFAPASEQLHE